MSLGDRNSVTHKGPHIMAEHEHGSMNIEVQEKTYAGFMSFVTKSVIVILLILVGMAIFFR